MCDVKKYSDIFREIKKLNPDDTLHMSILCNMQNAKILVIT